VYPRPELSELSALPAVLHPPLSVARSLAEARACGVTEAHLAGVDCLLLNAGPSVGPHALSELLSACPSLQWVHTSLAGVNNSLPALLNTDVVLTNAKGVFSHSLAEWTLFACSFFAKSLPRLLAAQHRADWAPYEVETLRGKTMGIIGFGDIGRTTGTLARAYGMKVVALRRTAATPDDVVAQFYPAHQLNDLLAVCDYVVLCTPLTAETQSMIGASAFAAMKPTAVFINIGRGPCVDEGALIEALRCGRIRGAALDVFQVEPLPKESPLWALPNVLLSPHNADRTCESHAESVRAFVANAERYVQGGVAALTSVVDKRAGY